MTVHPAPKPEPRPIAPRSFSSIKPKSHAEKLLARRKLQGKQTPIPKKNTKRQEREAWVKRQAAIRASKRRRKAAEFARTFHSQERVLFVKTLTCFATGQFGSERDPIDNAHVCDDGTKGTGRRSGYACIAPLKHSAHMLLHRNPERFAKKYGAFDWPSAAAWTEQQFQRFLGAGGR